MDTLSLSVWWRPPRRLEGGEINLVATQLQLDREHPNRLVFSVRTPCSTISVTERKGIASVARERDCFLWRLREQTHLAVQSGATMMFIVPQMTSKDCRWVQCGR